MSRQIPLTDAPAPQAPLSRRRFVKRATAATLGITLAAPAILRGQNLNNKLRIAAIGTGGRGASNLAAVASEDIVALCDVNERSLGQAGRIASQGPHVQRFPQAVR